MFWKIFHTKNIKQQNQKKNLLICIFGKKSRIANWNCLKICFCFYGCFFLNFCSFYGYFGNIADSKYGICRKIRNMTKKSTKFLVENFRGIFFCRNLQKFAEIEKIHIFCSPLPTALTIFCKSRFQRPERGLVSGLLRTGHSQRATGCRRW